MKKKIIIMLFAMLLTLTSLYSMTCQEILQKMDEVLDYKTVKMTALMKIINKEGNETKMDLVVYEKREGDKSLMRFTHPPRLKDTAILTVGDNIWYYNRRTNRVRLLSVSAKSGSMMGSSFSYDDMSVNYLKDFKGEITKDSENIYILKLFPNDTSRKYKYLIVTVPKNTFVATHIKYYNQSDYMYKSMENSNIKDIKGHIVPLNASMTEISTQKVTVFEIDENNVEYNLEFDDNMFSERYLKK